MKKVANIKTIGFNGIKIFEVNVQVAKLDGIPAFNIVGLPGKVIQESKYRIKSAMDSAGIDIPFGTIIVNMTPADEYKEGSHFDLPIIIGILVIMGRLRLPPNLIAVGEISLNGDIMPIKGIMNIASYAYKRGIQLMLPALHVSVLALFPNIEVIPISNIKHFACMRARKIIARNIIEEQAIQKTTKIHETIPIIYGQHIGKRAIQIAAAGYHSILMSGPPGCGKTMLADRLHRLLPMLTLEDAIEVNAIHSMLGNIINNADILLEPPFRQPHHSASLPAIIGGGSKSIRPGEISLAHKGLLFLDELPEFKSHVIEGLRQPLEMGKVIIARANTNAEYPCDFLFAAAMNLCRCNYTSKKCPNAPRCQIDYKKKISGPILDRIDIHTTISGVQSKDTGPDIQKTIHQIQKARKRQFMRQGTYNSKYIFDIPSVVAHDVQPLIDRAIQSGKCSFRGLSKTIGMAMTIADLDNSDVILAKHFIEAMSYRML